MFSVLLAKLRILPRGRGSVFRRGGGTRELACSFFAADGLWSARPGCELGAQRSDIVVAEPVAGELLVGNAVELLAGIGEVFCGQAGIEAMGEANQLRRAIAIQHPRGVGIVADFDTAGQRAYLAARYVLQRKNRADLHHHRRPAAVELGHLQHRLLAAGTGDDPLGQPLAHAREQIGHAGCVVLPFGP